MHLHIFFWIQHLSFYLQLLRVLSEGHLSVYDLDGVIRDVNHPVVSELHGVGDVLRNSLIQVSDG